MTESQTVYVSIGNSDNKLTHAEWAEFYRLTDELMQPSTGLVTLLHGAWHSLPARPFENACWCIEVSRASAAEAIQVALRALADKFEQDWIAWAIADTTVISRRATPTELSSPAKEEEQTEMADRLDTAGPEARWFNDGVWCNYCAGPHAPVTCPTREFPAEVVDIAQRFHDTYELYAPAFGYTTRKDSAVSWDRVPGANRRLMIAVVADVLAAIHDAARNVGRETLETPALDRVIDDSSPGWTTPTNGDRAAARAELVKLKEHNAGRETETEPWGKADERAAFERLLDAISNAYDVDADSENVEMEVAVAVLNLRDAARRYGAHTLDLAVSTPAGRASITGES